MALPNVSSHHPILHSSEWKKKGEEKIYPLFELRYPSPALRRLCSPSQAFRFILGQTPSSPQFLGLYT